MKAEPAIALNLRDLMTRSDGGKSPQAAVLSPAATIEIAQAIVAERDPYRRTVAAGLAAVDILERGVQSGLLTLRRKEAEWLERIATALDELPPDWRALMAVLEPDYGDAYDKLSYELD